MKNDDIYYIAQSCGGCGNEVHGNPDYCPKCGYLLNCDCLFEG